MTTKVTRADLTAALNWAARALPARPATPAMAGVRMRAQDGTLTLSAFDYEQSAAASIPYAGSPMDALPPGRLLADIARSAKGTHIDLDVSPEGNRVTVASGASSFVLPLLQLADYPALPSVPPALGTASGTAFADAIRAVACAASADPALPVLTSISVTADPGAGRLTLAATDRYRLATTTVAFMPDPGIDATMSFLVPARTLDVHAKSFGDADSITLHHGGDASLFGVSGLQMTATTRLIDGQFPNYAPLLPASFAATAIVDRGELAAAVKRVMIVADSGKPVRLAFEPGSVTVSYGDGGAAQQAAREAVECEYAGDEPIAIAFNPAFLADGLGHLPGERSRIGLVAPAKPALLSSVDASSAYRYLLMPTRD